jgi:hypothetical protein
MDFDRYTFVYNGISRVYRNSVVQLIRRQLTWDQVESTFKDSEIAHELENAQIPRVTGRISTPLGDDYEILGVSHFYNLFERYFEDLLGISTASSAGKQTKTDVMNWAREVKNLRDPSHHPPTVDLSFPDAYRYLDSGARILNTFDVESAKKLRSLIAELPLDIDIPDDDDPVFNSLPPEGFVVSQFVGRDEELAKLHAWIKTRREPVRLLAGAGGRGKSSIAYEFARLVARDGLSGIQAVLWVTAKKRVFVDGMVVDSPVTDFESRDSAVSALLTQLGASQSDLDQSFDKRFDLLEDILGETKCLVIADDLDSLDSNDEDATKFFAWEIPLASPSTKVLITSRRVQFGMGSDSITVDGFQRAEADAFIDNRATRLGIELDGFTSGVRQKLFEVSEGSPLYLEEMLRLVSSGEEPGRAAVNWESHGSGARQYALRREIELLGDDAKDVLIACTISDGPVTEEQLTQVTRSDLESVRSAMNDLRQLFLVSRPSPIEGVLHISVNANTAQLVREVFGNDDQWARIENSQRLASSDVTIPRSRPSVRQAIRQAVFLAKAGKSHEAEQTLLAEENPDDPDASLLSCLGWIYSIWNPVPRNTDSIHAFSASADAGSRDTRTFSHWLKIYFFDREYNQAAEVAQRGLNIRPNNRELLYWSGRCNVMVARGMLIEAHPLRAIEAVATAEEHLIKAFTPVEEQVSGEDWFMNARVYRTLAEAQELILQLTVESESPRAWNQAKKNLATTVRLWSAEHPDDQYAKQEAEHLKAGLET